MELECKWCEEPGNMVILCKLDDHQICIICYEKYQKQFPKRVKGCPYCKGIEEVPMIVGEERSDEIGETLFLRVRENHSHAACGNICTFCCWGGIIVIVIMIVRSWAESAGV